MIGVLVGSIVGLNLAIFLTLGVYTFLLDLALQNRYVHWLNFMTLGLAAMSVAEFFHVLTPTIPGFQWITSLENMKLFTNLAYVVAGIGLFMFLQHIKSNPKRFY